MVNSTFSGTFKVGFRRVVANNFLGNEHPSTGDGCALFFPQQLKAVVLFGAQMGFLWVLGLFRRQGER